MKNSPQSRLVRLIAELKEWYEVAKKRHPNQKVCQSAEWTWNPECPNILTCGGNHGCGYSICFDLQADGTFRLSHLDDDIITAMKNHRFGRRLIEDLEKLLASIAEETNACAEDEEENPA